MYAKWSTEGHVVRYIGYDGTLVLASFQVAEGTVIDPMTPPTPEAGYAFTGWYTEAAPMGTLFDFSQPITQDHDLYAHRELEYVVSFITAGVSLRRPSCACGQYR